MNTLKFIHIYYIVAFAVSLLVQIKPVMWDFLYGINKDYRQDKVAGVGTANMLSKFAPSENSTVYGERLP